MSPGLSAILLLVLFLCSGFFSASETALFSMRREDRVWFRQRGGRAARCVLDLLEQPHSLLVAVLFGNLVVNFLLMSVSARLAYELTSHGALGLVLGFVLTTVSVVVLGEVTPKSIAVTIPRRVALLAAPPLLVFRNLSRPVIAPFGNAVSWTLDFVDRRWPPRGPLTDQELKRFVELYGQEGIIERQATEFLAEVLELGSRRVHEVMTPRVDLLALDRSASRQEFLDLVREHRRGKVLIHDGGGLDRIEGYVRTRDVLRNPDAELTDLMKPVWFVPSTKSLESLLREMIDRNEPLALALGEYGGTDGLVTLEDVAEEITGDIAREGRRPLLMPGPDGTWIMAGRFPLREAGELLGIKFEVPGPTTLSGFVAQRLGRLPEGGDAVWHAGVQYRVGSIEGRRAREIVVSLPQPGRRVPQGTQTSERMTRSGALRAKERLTQWVAESSPSPSEEEEQRDDGLDARGGPPA